MKIEIQKIVRPLALADYAAEYQAAVMQVWVNPPKTLKSEIWANLGTVNSLLDKLRELKGPEHEAKRTEISAEIDGLGEQIIVWLSELWSQGLEETRMSIDDIKSLIADTRENDPALYQWLVKRSWTMILEYQAGIKKN